MQECRPVSRVGRQIYPIVSLRMQMGRFLPVKQIRPSPFLIRNSGGGLEKPADWGTPLAAAIIRRMDGDRDAWSVLNFYSSQRDLVRRMEPLGSAGGWSGSRLWRLECSGGQILGLRRWPEGHPTAERLRLIHEVLAQVAARGLRIVPAPLQATSGETFVEFDDRYWELTPWLTGQADFHLRPTKGRLQAAMEALARFHEFAASADPHCDHPPCLAERELELTTLLRGGIEEIVSAVARGVSPELDSRAQRILTAAGGRLGDLATLVQVAARQMLPLQPAIRDIHRDHVLYTGDDVTGIVDFGAMRIDTPLTDVARLIGSLVGDDRAARTVAFEAYATVRPLSETDRQVIDLLDESGVVLGGLHWLQWLYLERRDMGEMEPIIQRLDGILNRLERRGIAGVVSRNQT